MSGSQNLAKRMWQTHLHLLHNEAIPLLLLHIRAIRGHFCHTEGALSKVTGTTPIASQAHQTHPPHSSVRACSLIDAAPAHYLSNYLNII